MSDTLTTRLLMAALSAGILPAASAPVAAATPPTVILVHGAFENSAAWSSVIPLLQRRGLKVVAVQNPLTSLDADVQNTQRTIADQDGAVLLVGHSYGGAVITQAGNDTRVKGLVYVAAVSPNSGESGLDEAAPYPRPALLDHLFVDKSGMAYATEAGITDLGQDVPAAQRRVLLATQEPIAFAAFQGKVTQAAWESRPSWSIVADLDHAISPLEEAEAGMRIKATVVHLRSGHSVMLTHPRAVAEVIIAACDAVASQP